MLSRRLSLSVCAAVLAAFAFVVPVRADKEAAVKSPLAYKMKKLDGKEVDLASYKGKVVLFVNVASQCGLTGQYEGLQDLHEKYGKEGLAIIGVPANEFGRQEPGSNEEIATFCKKNYGVGFDMLSKVVVKGDGICDLYKHLTSSESNPKFSGPISWNFEKFLVGRDGQVVARFAPRTSPDDAALVKVIETEIAKK
jgi:glutathione peroxidase